MKREREVDHSITLANCLMLLSRGGQFDNNYASDGGHRVFECKTCNRQFPSFQALGGHRASHKKPRPAAAAGEELEIGRLHLDAKPKTHECPICGMEFAIGQALGGHMRRHRDRNSNNNNGHKTQSSTITMSTSSSGSSLDSRVNDNHKRERVLSLDLNLTPFENDLEFLKIGIANSV